MTVIIKASVLQALPADFRLLELLYRFDFRKALIYLWIFIEGKYIFANNRFTLADLLRQIYRLKLNADTNP